MRSWRSPTRARVAVPLDVRHTVDFGRKIVAQTGAKLVVASRQTEASARQLGLPIVWIETLPDRARRATPLPSAPVTGDTLAEIVFTSGTTGEPKGAMLSHGNLMASATAMTQVLPFDERDRLLSVLPLSHLYEQVLGFMGPLIVGASIVYPVSRQPAVLIRTFRDFKVSVLLIVPQGLRLLNAAIERQVDQAGRRARFEQAHRIARRAPRGFVGCCSGRFSASSAAGSTRSEWGSALDLDVAQRWTEMGVDILQGYGATEMGPVVSFTRPERNVIGTVGEPIPGVEARIAEDGEILARGPGRFAGYWQNAEATAAAIDADGWYHTGDLGAFTDEGMLTFRGRKKDMLALPDGQKVYAEDVEAILRDDERVKDAAVVGWPLGADLRVHAVLLLDDPSLEDDVVASANSGLRHTSRSAAPPCGPIRTSRAPIRSRCASRTSSREWASSSDRARRRSRARRRRYAARMSMRTWTRHGRRGQRRRSRPAAVFKTSRLSSDLDLDSLRRVELLGVIEEELGVFVDDDALEPEATVADLAALVEAARGAKHGVPAWRWPLSPVVRAVGLAAQVLLIYPFVHVFYRVRVDRARADPSRGRPVPVHAEPLPPPRQRDHPVAAAVRRALEAVRCGCGRHDLRQPAAGRPRIRPRQRVPAGARGRRT